MNKASDGNAREISRQLGHNSRNFHENNPNFRRALRFFRAQRPGIPESSSHFRAEGAVFPIAQPEVPSALVAFFGRPAGVSDRPAELSGQATSLFGRVDLRRRRRLASTRILRFRPSTMSRDVGVAEPLVDRTDSDRV